MIRSLCLLHDLQPRFLYAHLGTFNTVLVVGLLSSGDSGLQLCCPSIGVLVVFLFLRHTIPGPVDTYYYITRP